MLLCRAALVWSFLTGVFVLAGIGGGVGAVGVTIFCCIRIFFHAFSVKDLTLQDSKLQGERRSVAFLYVAQYAVRGPRS